MIWEKKAKFFSSLGRLPFFSKICVFNNFLGPKKCSYKFASICQNSLWIIVNLSLRFVKIGKMIKMGQIVFFSLEILNFFSEICVFNNFLGPKKCSNKFQSNCQNSLWTPKKSPLRFITRDKRGNLSKNFFHRENSYFWNVCLYRPPRCQLNVHIICTVNVRIPFGP